MASGAGAGQDWAGAGTRVGLVRCPAQGETAVADLRVARGQTLKKDLGL